MSVNRHSLLIFDAACLVAAAGSPAGGSGLLVGLCVRGYFRGTASDLIVAEATRNARAKLGDLGATRLERALRSADLEPADATAITQVRLINAKDRHVIAATLSSGEGFLITLDRRLVSEVSRAGLGFAAATPGDFIREELPSHPDFPFAHH